MDVKVGQPLVFGKTRFNEGVRFTFNRDGAFLGLFMSSPTPHEVEDVSEEKLEIGMLLVPPTLLIPFRFFDAPWSVANYTPYLVPPERRVRSVQINKGDGFPLEVTLIDADTGIVRAIRNFKLPTKMSRQLLQHTKELEQQPWPGVDKYQQHLNHIYAMMPAVDVARTADIWELS